MSLVSCGELRQVFYPVFNEHFPKRDVQVSATNAEGPPVPIPNTEVKLCSGDNTLRETAREDSSMPTRKRRQGCLLFRTTKRDGERTTFYEKETGASSGSRRTRRKNSGGVAQLGEHLPCKQGVMSSNLIISTNPGKPGNRLRVSGSSEDGSPKEENQGRDTTNCIGS